MNQTQRGECYECGTFGHSRQKCFYNVLNPNGKYYKSDAPDWVKSYQNGVGKIHNPSGYIPWADRVNSGGVPKRKNDSNKNDMNNNSTEKIY